MSVYVLNALSCVQQQTHTHETICCICVHHDMKSAHQTATLCRVVSRVLIAATRLLYTQKKYNEKERLTEIT